MLEKVRAYFRGACVKKDSSRASAAIGKSVILTAINGIVASALTTHLTESLQRGRLDAEMLHVFGDAPEAMRACLVRMT